MLDISDISYTMGISWELDSMKFLGLMEISWQNNADIMNMIMGTLD